MKQNASLYCFHTSVVLAEEEGMQPPEETNAVGERKMAVCVNLQLPKMHYVKFCKNP